jgi:hypothetical protein
MPRLNWVSALPGETHETFAWPAAWHGEIAAIFMLTHGW